MPNWCDNSLTIFGTPKKLQEILKVIENYASEDPIHKDATGLLAYCMSEPDYETTPVAKTFPEIDAKYASTEEEKKKALENKPTIREGSWWDWRVQNWGTKWEIEAEVHDISDGSIGIVFLSAWSPPIGAYDALLKQEGIHGIHANYYEMGNCFGGVYKNGVDDCINLDQITPKQFRECETLEELNDSYGLYEDMLNYSPLLVHPEWKDMIEGIGEEQREDLHGGDLRTIYHHLKDKEIKPGSISILKKSSNPYFATHFVFEGKEYILNE